MTGNKRRSNGLIFLVAMGLLFAAGWFALVNPWLNWRRDIADQILETSARVGQFKAVNSQSGGVALQAQLERQFNEQFSPDYLRGDSEAIILADLQSRITEIVAEEGCDLVLARQLPSKVRAGSKSLGLNVRISGDIRAMMAVIHRIEAGKPILFVDNARLALSDGASLAAAEGSDIIEMSVDLDVYGALWEGAPSAGGET